ncbi:PrpF family protein [Bosea sp. Root381]|uniref:2-methylaconitate cis-trans isomerase PrpF family protein n=1 Tax=Bosea sp. Root381 TaxID=1736524 RepID=UPI0006FA810C|nr:PrpF domain-containing protein [Bosea sp. Root381]KRE18235.1 PrpF family protein [Bosea sp. Root381]
MPQSRLRASFMRGGTSKAVVFNRSDLPSDPADWDAIFLAVMGSPDGNGRQLDGMGGGVSSVSKVCIVGPSSRSDADIDYTFAQVAVKEAVVDYSGNCGNMSSAMGPFAVMEGLASVPADGEAAVRVHNTNTGKVIVARFPMSDGEPATQGELGIDGVAGTGAPVRLEFVDPGGTKTGRLLPTGQARDRLTVVGLGEIEVSMVDAANPCVFVRASVLAKSGRELPDELERDGAFLQRMEAIRCAASVAMGIAPDEATAAKIPSVPKVAMIAAPAEMPTLSGRIIKADEMSIAIRMISIGQPHRAVPITGATCLAIAVRVAGSLPHELARQDGGPITVAHPSGTTVVDAEVAHADDPARARAVHGAVYRTARRLFDGHVYYQPRQAAEPARLAAE